MHSSNPCKDIASTLRRVVGDVADRTVAARLKTLAANYEQRAVAHTAAGSLRRKPAERSVFLRLFDTD
jgi:hypothetical protein